LTAVRGIGRWSAEVFLIFQLGRLDILPADDVGLRNAASKAYRLESAPTAGELLEMGEKWRPYRSMASWYLWWNLDNKG
jgi:3-methyladenine DNA glycosylase/8-oxoguanine DNA glycosylase